MGKSKKSRHTKVPAASSFPAAHTGKVSAGHFQEKGVIFFYAALAAVFLIVIAVKIIYRQSIEFDFANSSVAGQWEWQGDASPTSAAGGILIKTDKPHFLFSPGTDKTTFLGNRVIWRQFPYVKVELDKVPAVRRASFVWNPRLDKKMFYTFPFQIPQNRDAVIVNVQKTELWNHRVAFNGPVVQFGFQFDPQTTREVLIKKISLLSFPPPSDFLRMVFEDCGAVEEILPFSINFTAGIDVLSEPLVYSLGILIAILGLVFLCHNSKLTKAVLVTAALGCFIVIDLTFDHALWGQLIYSSARSAWHASKYDEYLSRFSQTFADLARKFEETVPAGAKVFFPRERNFQVRGETNWIRFLYYPQYQPVELRDADYIFAYHPKDYRYDTLRSVFYAVDKPDQAVNASVMFEIEPEAKLLKVTHV